MSPRDLDALSRDELLAELRSLRDARDEVARLQHAVALLAQEKARLEHELDAHEETWGRYSRLYDEAPVALLLLDRKGIVRTANRAAALLVGYDQALMIGKPFIVVARMRDAAHFWRHLQRCLEQPGPVSTEIELVRDRGDVGAACLVSSVLPDPSLGVVIATALTDLNQRIEIEREVKRAHDEERRVRARLEAQVRAGAAIGEAQVEMHVRGVDSVLQAIAEQARHLVDGEIGAVAIGGARDQPFDHWTASGVPNDGSGAPRRAGLLERAASGAIVRTVDGAPAPELAGLPAGHAPITSFLAVPVRHRDRSVGTLYVANKRTAADFDVDDERALVLLAEYAVLVIEAALAADAETQERGRLRTILDQLPEAVVVQDVHGHPVPNARALRLAVVSGRVDPLGNPIRWDFRFPDGRSVPWSELPLVRAFVDHEPAHNVELAVVTSDGRAHPVLIDAVPLVDDHGRSLGAVAVWRDIEQLKQLEQLRQEWSAVVAHDLRQPLSQIRLWDRLLSSGEHPRDEQAKRAAAAIERSVRRMSDMLDDLIDTTLVETHRVTLRKARFDLGELVRDVVEGLAAAAQRARLLAPPDLPSVDADRGRVERVLENLLSNAFKYGTEGTEVVVAVVRGEGELEVTVSNVGPTLSPDEARNLFSRFYRAPSGRGKRGLGLGLYIARGFIEAHGGRLWCEPGEGRTTFHFTLPCGERAGEERQPQPTV